LFRQFNLEDDTVAIRLKAQGYATGYFGKYMNGYGDGPEGKTYVAPGWGRWFVLAARVNRPDSYTINSDGTLRDFSRAEWNETDLLGDRAASFIRSNNGRAWLCYMGIHSPHGPYYPAPRHAHDFDGVMLPRPPSYAEEDVSDKPQEIRERIWTDENGRESRTRYEGTLEEQGEIDDLVGKLVGVLRETGQLNNTYIFYAADNGYFFGEHRLTAKGQPYEEATNVPYIMRGPGVSPGIVSDAFVTQIDLSRTFMRIGEASDAGMDGRNLLRVAGGAVPPDWRKRLLIEHPGNGWNMLRTGRWVYVERDTGEKELYDMSADPFQLGSQHANPANRDLMATLHDQLAVLKGCSGTGCRVAESS